MRPENPSPASIPSPGPAPAPTPANIDIAPSEVPEGRRSTHGPYAEQAAMHSILLAACGQGRNWQRLPPAQLHAFLMITMKMSRILTGNNNFVDHWTDIAGYAALVRDLLELMQANSAQNTDNES